VEAVNMKIYIMTDMEGASGIRRQEECVTGTAPFEAARKYLIGDVNAAIAGCFDGGATAVCVSDGHGGGACLDIEKMDPRAVYETECGSWKPLPGLDGSFAGLMAVGTHAMAGTMGAFLDHTQSSANWHNYLINGERYGEIGQWAAVAGDWGVPLLFVSGDRAACEEVRRQFPGAGTVAVKEAITRNLARLTLSPELAHRAIRDGARAAMALAKTLKPWKLQAPIEVRLEFNRSDHADNVAHHAGVERVDARTVRKLVSRGRDVMYF
jgi:D-amino peptidase